MSIYAMALVLWLQLDNGVSVDVDVLVVDSNPLGFPLILGMNRIVMLGGVVMNMERCVCFGIEDMALCGVSDPGIAVEGQDFSAMFNPMMRLWKWSQNSKSGGLQNQIESYSVSCEAQVMYECELEKWIAEGLLTPYEEEKYGPAKGLTSDGSDSEKQGARF